MGILGVVLVTAGHWLSDFGYYVFVSFIMHRHASYVNPRQHQISTILELFLTALGVHFVQQGLEKIVLYFSLSFSQEKISAEIRVLYVLRDYGFTPRLDTKKLLG